MAAIQFAPGVDPDSLPGVARKSYRAMVNGEVFEIDERYTSLKYIGGGAYGFVCAAQDAVTKKRVAIKKIKDVFRDLTDAKRILREIKLLRHLGGHQNIIWILDIMVSPQRRNYKDVYIVTDLMDTDLAHIIASQQTLSDQHIKYFTYQMLRGLKYVHSAGVLHRDLKPQNILCNANCELVICDFGLARAIGRRGDGDGRGRTEDGEDGDMYAVGDLTAYVVTRWYRAPELLAQASSYGGAVDIWSVGCILAEILGRRPLFPGRQFKQQLQMIVDMVGTPSEEQMWFIRKSAAKRVILAMGHRPKADYRKMFPHANPEAIDLMDKMLRFDPSRRMTVDEALQHPYLADYHYPDDEPAAASTVRFDFDRMGTLNKSFLQARMVEEMRAHIEAHGKAAADDDGDGGLASAGGADDSAEIDLSSKSPADASQSEGSADRSQQAREQAERDSQRAAEIARQQAASSALGVLGGGLPGAASDAAPTAGTPKAGEVDTSGALDVVARLESALDRKVAQLETSMRRTVSEEVERAVTPSNSRLDRLERLVEALATGMGAQGASAAAAQSEESDGGGRVRFVDTSVGSDGEDGEGKKKFPATPMPSRKGH